MNPKVLVTAAALLAWLGGSAPGQTPPEGSTVLVYKAEPYGDQVPKIDLELLVSVLKKRLDSNTNNITVRSLDMDRVEIVLPRKAGEKPDVTSENVKQIKSLLSRSGILELRILANQADDAEAIREAMELFKNLKGDPQRKAVLDKAQLAGQPPPSLWKATSMDLKPFTIKLPGGESNVTYSWVELGPQERKALSLDPDAGKDDKRGAYRRKVFAEARDKGLAVQVPSDDSSGQMLLQGALFFSRECKNANLPKEERQQKKYEYFVLARNPEIDPATGKETARLDGRYLILAAATKDAGGRPSVAFTFNDEGGKLLGQLSKKNVPSGEGGNMVRRHLAIILDGQVVSAPSINSEIGKSGQISGNFTVREVNQMVSILRAGALPSNARLVLVSETVVGPQKK